MWVSGNWDTGWQVRDSTDITCVGVRELGYRMAGRKQFSARVYLKKNEIFVLAHLQISQNSTN